MFNIYFRPRALEALESSERKLQLKINSAVDDLRLGKQGYRLRVGRWRTLFALFSEEKRIEIVDIFLKKGEEDYTKRMKLLQ